MSQRSLSAASGSARANAVSTTFDSSYALDDSVTTPRTIAHLDARSDTLAGSPSVLIVPDRCSSVISICRNQFPAPLLQATEFIELISPQDGCCTRCPTRLVAVT